MAVADLMKKLRAELAAMGELVETNVNSAIMALIERSVDMAQEVVDFDIQVDEMEIALEKRGLEILSLARPQSDEFRFVIAAIKIANDLERMSDLAVDIARNVGYLVTKRSIQTDLSNFAEMLEFTSMMVRDSVLSLLDRDEGLAFRVCAHQDLVDDAYDSLEARLYEIMEKDPKKAVRASHLLLCARDLARIAGLAKNIAEDVIYILEGKLVHHHIDEWRKKLAPELEKRRSNRMKKRTL